MSFALQFSGTGSTENENELALNYKTMDFIKQFWNFWYLVDNNQGVSGLVF